MPFGEVSASVGAPILFANLNFEPPLVRPSVDVLPAASRCFVSDLRYVA